MVFDTTAAIKKALIECTGLDEIPLADGGEHADLATTVAFSLAKSENRRR